MSKKKARTIRPLGRAANASRGHEPRNRTAEIFEGGAPGPGVTRADDGTIRAVLSRIDPDRPWAEARRDVLPMLPRIRPYPFPIEPVRTMLPPGILAGFGIDIGPALQVVDGGQLERWGVDLATVAGRALENVRREAARTDPGGVLHEPIHGVPVMALQTGRGIGASMLLVPETLERFFGAGPLLLLAPMRDLMVALPASVDHGFASWLADEWESMDPNHLHLGGWLYEAGTLCSVPLEGAFARA